MSRQENVVWTIIILEKIFKVSKGSYLHSDKISKGNTPYITAKAVDNGVHSFIENKPLFDKKSITIEKVSLKAYYQSTAFYCSHDVSVLQNEKLNKFNSLFISSIISRNGVKYNYGRQAQMNVVKRERILLPTIDGKMPDYNYMEAYSKNLYLKKRQDYLNHINDRLDHSVEVENPIPLQDKTWRAFLISDIADILSGRDIYELERTTGSVPYVSSTANNNGIGYYVGNLNSTLERDCLSVNRNGSVGYSFYHPYGALFSNDCRKLRLKVNSRYAGFFISNQITMQREKYGYGYKMGTARLLKQKIMLPIDDKARPDYDYMEHYIKHIELKKLRNYANKIETVDK